MAVVLLETSPEFDSAMIVEAAEDAAEQSARFAVVDVPDSALIHAGGDNLLPAISGLAAEHSLDVILALSLGEPVSVDRIVAGPDSTRMVTRTDVWVSGRFYTSSGQLIGSISESGFAEFPSSLPRDGSVPARDAVVRMVERAMLELFPAEVEFEAAGSGGIILPSGTESGFHKGMFVSIVAIAPSIPLTAEGFDYLHSRALAQVIEAGPGESRARLLSGGVTPGGPVTAIEHGAPAFVSIGWDGVPVELEQGAAAPSFDGSGMINRVSISVTTFRWGMCFGGTLHGGTMEDLSSFGVGFHAGPRIPLSPPETALRLTLGGEVDFMMQDVAVDYLLSDASAVTFGGFADCALEYLPFERLGFFTSARGYLGSSVDSWTVQDESGQTRSAMDAELHFTELAPSPLRFRAGMYYLIF